MARRNILDRKNNKIKSPVGPVSLFRKKLSLTTRWSWSTTLRAVCRSCPNAMFWLPFGNRCTHPGEGSCQISHIIPEVNDFRPSSSISWLTFESL